MGIKRNDICSMCQVKSDSNPHMLILCQKSKKFWLDVERWIIHLGVKDYVLTENSIITGDINKGRLFTIIILFAKITIYSAKLKEKTPNFFSFKSLLKQQYIQAKYFAIINGKVDKFEKEWHLLVNEWS